MIHDLLPEWRGKLDPGLELIEAAGRSVSAFDIARAQTTRSDLIATGSAFLERYDLLLTPPMTLPPFPV